MIRTKLMAHQEIMVDFMKDKPYHGLFADFGVGKTLCALSYIDSMQFRKTLVVSTKTAIESTWPQEIRKHTDIKYVLLLGDRKEKLSLLYRGLKMSMVDSSYYHSSSIQPVIFLVNFEGVKNIFNELVQANFDYIVVDESTKIKSPKTLRTKILWALAKNIDKRCVMTGFPVTENISEIYSQIKFIDLGTNFGDSWYAFMNRYFTRINYRYLPKKKGVEEILGKIKPFCIRVTADVLKLPPKVYNKIEVEQTQIQKKIFAELNSTFQLEFGKVSIDTKYIFALINRSLQICDGFVKDENGNLEVLMTNKDVAVIELVEEIDPAKNKILIWFNFLFSLRKIEKIFTKLGYNVLTLCGDTEDSSVVVNKFQFDNKYNILLTTLKKSSASITLTNCKYAIYYSNIWSWDQRSNSEARIYRKGAEKHDSVIYTDLLVKDTIEQDVLDCLLNKKDLIDKLKEEFRNVQAKQ